MQKHSLSIETCFSPLSYPLFQDSSKIVVVVDIFRATSAIVTAFQYGINSIVPVAKIEDAEKYKDQGFLVAVERNGEVVNGFELGNSPYSYMTSAIKGKNLALTTTNGTQAIEVAKQAKQIIIGSFLNVQAVADFLIAQNQPVLILCAGWKNKFNLEDSLFAGALAELLVASTKFTTECDSTISAMQLHRLGEKDLFSFLANSSHRKRLEKLNLEKDVTYCLQKNSTQVIPIWNGSALVAN